MTTISLVLAALTFPGPAFSPEPLLALNPGGHTALVAKALFTPDGRRVVTVSQDKTIRIWDTASGAPVQVLRPPIDRGWEGSLFTAALSPDGRTLAVGGHNEPGRRWARICLISLDEGRLIRVLSGHVHSVGCLAFSPDGKRLASGSRDKTVILWNVATGAYERMLVGHTGHVWDVAWSPDGRRLVSASHDGTARIWSAKTGRSEAVLPRHAAEVDCVAWSPDGRTIATGGWDHRVILWNADGSYRWTFERLGNQVQSLSFAPDSRRLLVTRGSVAIADYTCSIHDILTGRELVRFARHDNTLLDGRFSRDGRLVVTTGGNNDETYVWRADDARVVSRMVGIGKVPWSAGWSPDGRSVAWGDAHVGQTVDARSPLKLSFDLNELILRPVPARGAGYRVARHANGPLSLDAAERDRVSVVHGRTTRAIFKLPPDYPTDRVRCFTLLSDDLAAVGTDYQLYLIDTRTGGRVRTFKGHNAEIWAVAPSPDGRYLLSASADRTLRVWKPGQDEPLLSLFVAGTEWIAWTPNGYYASSGGGERLMGWHVNNGKDALASFHPAVRFRQSLYRPDVIRRLLEAGSVELALAQADEARGVAKSEPKRVEEVLPPKVAIVAPGARAEVGRRFVVRARAESVGDHPVVAMRLLLDGRPYRGQAARKVVDPRKLGETTQEWEVEIDHPGRVRVAVVAESAVSEALSPEVVVAHLGNDVPETPGKPDLHVLIVGVSAYSVTDLRLYYAKSDALDLAAVVKDRCRDVYDEIKIHTLTDGEATKENILRMLGELKNQSTQADDCVVYFAGHGQKDAEDRFFLLPADVRPGELAGTAIADSELQEALAGIPALHLILFLDACHSGSRRIINLCDNLVRTLLREGEDGAVMVLAAASSQQAALESHGSGQSYFTSALIDGLKGKAASYDSFVYNTQLLGYVPIRVFDQTKGQQQPTGNLTPAAPPFKISKVETQQDLVK